MIIIIKNFFFFNGDTDNEDGNGTELKIIKLDPIQEVSRTVEVSTTKKIIRIEKFHEVSRRVEVSTTRKTRVDKRKERIKPCQKKSKKQKVKSEIKKMKEIHA